VVAPDRLRWSASKQGFFTVRSAYFLEKTRRAQKQGESSNQGATKKFWKMAWALKIPPVLRTSFGRLG
jgi:hypothetical protein